MSETMDVHCPSCGEVIHEGVEYGDTPGAACPNYCGWIEVGWEDDAMVVRNGVCSY